MRKPTPQARQRAADALAERRARDADNVRDLETFFEADKQLNSIADEVEKTIRDAIAAANTKADARREAHQNIQADVIARMRQRGERDTDIAALTGLTTKHLRQILQTTSTATTVSADNKTDTDTDTGTDIDTGPGSGADTSAVTVS